MISNIPKNSIIVFEDKIMHRSQEFFLWFYLFGFIFYVCLPCYLDLYAHKESMIVSICEILKISDLLWLYKRMYSNYLKTIYWVCLEISHGDEDRDVVAPHNWLNCALESHLNPYSYSVHLSKSMVSLLCFSWSMYPSFFSLSFWIRAFSTLEWRGPHDFLWLLGSTS